MSKFYSTPTQPLQAAEGDFWVDTAGNIHTLLGNTWLHISTAYREKEPDEDVIPQPEPAVQVPGEYMPDLDPTSVDDKIAVFEQKLAEPPQRLGYEKLTMAMLEKAVDDAMNSGTSSFTEYLNREQLFEKYGIVLLDKTQP